MDDDVGETETHTPKYKLVKSLWKNSLALLEKLNILIKVK